MPNYQIDGHNLSDLFDTHSPRISFSEDPRTYIPKTGSIIYSVWDHDEKFIYIGISGLQKALEKRDPLSRMVAHATLLLSAGVHPKVVSERLGHSKHCDNHGHIFSRDTWTSRRGRFDPGYPNHNRPTSDVK